jgi:signal transduction histidine kinase
LAVSLNRTREDEQRRIARDLHDDVVGRLSVLLFDLGRMRAQQPIERAGDSDKLMADTKSIVDSLRRVIRDLRPPMIDQFGLKTSLDWLCSEFARNTGVACAFICHPALSNLDTAIACTFYRIVQEALTNITRHAQATEAGVQLTQIDNSLQLRIEDNGRGMLNEDRSKSGSFGLQGMYERTLLLGGTFNIDSTPGSGTRIEISVPLVG